MDRISPIASSTPTNQFHKTRPMPIFPNENKLFQFKENKTCNERVLHPRSPIKSAPPVSRVFPHRNRVAEKPHAVSFRAVDEHANDSTLCSRFYDSNSSDLYFEQCFVIEKKIGEGSFGEVMQVKSRDNNERYAVKRSREKFKGKSDRKRKLDEVRKHETLPDHPNCVKFIKAWEEKQRLYIQTELCSISLQDYLEQQQSIPIFFVWKYLIDLLQGLHHLHSHGFVHFDVKPANIFLSEDGTCKIGDFGLVIDCSNDDIDNAREGDNKYMAPELLGGLFSVKADVFSLGITMLELASGLDLPSNGASWQMLRSGYLPQECTCMIPFPLLTIIRWMMDPDYNQRPTVHEVLVHPTVKSYHQRLKVNMFIDSYFWKLVHAVYFALNALFSVVSLPLTAVKWMSNKEEVADGFSKNNVNFWEDTSISNEHLSKEVTVYDLSDSFEALEKNQAHATYSPFTPNYSHYTPSPRNSSPVAHRSAKLCRQSPKLSPLSHNKPFTSKDVYNKSSHLGNEFDCFISDDSDFARSEDEASMNSFFSYPRNLINMLNEVSDTDNSEKEHSN